MLASITRQLAPGVRESGLLARIERAKRLAASYESAWQPHIEATRQTIRDAVRAVPNGNRLVLHSTGWSLDDLPIAELASHGADVELVAPVWWRTSKRRTKAVPSIRLTVHEATDYLQAFAKAPEAERPMPGKGDLRAPIDGNVLSVNLLAELLAVIGPVRHPSEDDIDRARALTGAHVAALEASNGKALLITAFARYETRRGKSERLEILPSHVLTQDPFTTWDWHMAPLGAIEAGLDVHMKVGAWWL